MKTEIILLLNILVIGCVPCQKATLVHDDGELVVEAVSLLPNLPYVEQSILESASMFDDWIPKEEDASIVARKGLYFSLGTTREDELVRLAKRINSELKLVMLTNGCNVAGSADYNWLDARNMDNILDRYYAWMSNNGFTKHRRLCGIGSYNKYRDTAYHVITTHYSVLYSCLMLKRGRS